jgi:hypothetical protein
MMVVLNASGVFEFIMGDFDPFAKMNPQGQPISMKRQILALEHTGFDFCGFQSHGIVSMRINETPLSGKQVLPPLNFVPAWDVTSGGPLSELGTRWMKAYVPTTLTSSNMLPGTAQWTVVSTSPAMPTGFNFSITGTNQVVLAYDGRYFATNATESVLGGAYTIVATNGVSFGNISIGPNSPIEFPAIVASDIPTFTFTETEADSSSLGSGAFYLDADTFGTLDPQPTNLLPSSNSEIMNLSLTNVDGLPASITAAVTPDQDALNVAYDGAATPPGAYYGTFAVSLENQPSVTGPFLVRMDPSANTIIDDMDFVVTPYCMLANPANIHFAPSCDGAVVSPTLSFDGRNVNVSVGGPIHALFYFAPGIDGDLQPDCGIYFDVWMCNGAIVLLTTQTNAVQNGLWIVNQAGAWTRDPRFANGQAFEAGTQFVYLKGMDYDPGNPCVEGATFELTNSGTVGVDEMTFVRVNPAGTPDSCAA